MFNVIIKSGVFETVISCSEKTNISDLLKKHIPNYSMPCGGNHSCGKCIVRADGEVSLITAEEAALLKGAGAAESKRLACFLTALGDCEIELQNISEANENVIETGFFSDGKSLKASEAPACGVDNSTEYGIAVDLGTTTIIAYLAKNGNVNPLACAAEMNDQRRFGADVISRIDHCMKNGAEELSAPVRAQLSRIFLQLLEQNGISNRQISSLAITGNTAMLHMLMGYDTSSIAAYPFTPKSHFNEYHSASVIFPELENATLYLPMCIGGYIGADILCAVEASGMTRESGLSMLVDVGTNGEMAIYRSGVLYACSTAAGPAFEGAGIRMGTTARDGVVTDIELANGSLSVKTIKDKPPVGICGTGLINVTALLLELSIIDETGYISDENEEYSRYLGEDAEGSFVRLGESGIILTQKDIRQLQLAKSAIHAGMLTLAHECGVNIEDIDKLYLCGGFGSCINPQKAAEIGLIPRPLAKKAVMLGNAAGKGCLDMLFSKDVISHSVLLSESAVDISLSTSSFFMDQYVEQMLFT